MSYFSPKDDEVAHFCYGEEIDHELDFQEVAEKSGDEAGGVTTDEEGGADDIITVTKKEDMDSQTTLAYASCLKKLAELKVPARCKTANCQAPLQLDIKQVGTAMYLKWVGHKIQHFYSHVLELG